MTDKAVWGWGGGMPKALGMFGDDEISLNPKCSGWIYCGVELWVWVWVVFAPKTYGSYPA